MDNALTIDLEFWHSPELVRSFVTEEGDGNSYDLISEMTKPVLDVLDEQNVKATFFVLGLVAEKYPELIKDIYDKGHEIASHAYSHKTLHELGKDEFEREIEMSLKLLRHITKEATIGFRAPSFSIDNSTRWAFEVLEKYNFKYDSSVFPIKTKLYGVPNAPSGIYSPSIDNMVKENLNGKIIEFPITTFDLGVRIPISGGFYLRAMPFWLTKSLLKKVNQTSPGIVYVHPWELYPEVPRLDLPVSSRLITYYGIRSSFGKFKGLLKNFCFITAREILGL